MLRPGEKLLYCDSSIIKTKIFPISDRKTARIAAVASWMRTEVNMDDEQNEDVMQAWAESAAYWEKHYNTIRSMFAPVTDALVAAARIAPGQRVLDVAG